MTSFPLALEGDSDYMEPRPSRPPAAAALTISDAEKTRRQDGKVTSSTECHYQNID
jgi:hypothetical protein